MYCSSKLKSWSSRSSKNFRHCTSNDSMEIRHCNTFGTVSPICASWWWKIRNTLRWSEKLLLMPQWIMACFKLQLFCLQFSLVRIFRTVRIWTVRDSWSLSCSFHTNSKLIMYAYSRKQGITNIQKGLETRNGEVVSEGFHRYKVQEIAKSSQLLL